MLKHKLMRDSADIGGTLRFDDNAGPFGRLVPYSPAAAFLAQAGVDVANLKPAGWSTGRDLHIDQHLTNVAIDYVAQNFVATQICPVVPVDKETNLYPVFSRFEFFQLEDDRRSRGKEANKVTRSVGSANYQCQNYALGYDITIEDRANMDAVWRQKMDTGAGLYVIDKLYLNMEKRVLTLADAAGSVSTSFVPSSSWLGLGDPISQTFQLLEYQKQQTGQWPNSLLFGWKAWSAFRRNQNVRNFINGTNNGGGVVTRQQAAALFEVERLVVTDAFWHTQNEAYVNSYVLVNPMADDIIAYYAPSAPSTDRPSWMYAFRWNNPALPAPLVIERHPYDSRKKVETIEAGYYQDERITGSDYASKLTGVNSAQSNGLA